MARKQAGAAGATATNGDTGGADTTKPKRTRDTSGALALNTEQKAILLGLILDRPGQLTTRDLVTVLIGHPAFATLVGALGSDKAPEKLRQQVKKMAKAAAKRGVMVALRRVAGMAGDYEGVVDAVLRARGLVVSSNVQAAPPAAAVQPIPGPLAGGSPGLIPVLPQGQSGQ